MKSSQGVIVAVGLGIAGALVNWFYLSSEASKIEMVSFIGVKPGILIRRSENIKVGSVVEVHIPKNHVGNLKKFAFGWEELNTVKDRPTWRQIDSDTGGATLLFRSDVQTPPAELDLHSGQMAVGIPVDAKMVVLQLIKPGTSVTFRVPTAPSLSMPTPVAHPISGTTPAAGAATSDPLQPEPDKTTLIPSTTVEDIGPFKVLSVGNRLGDAAVMRAAKIPQTQENIINILVQESEVGEKQRFEKLWSRLEAIGFHGVGVEILGPKE
jgi:hypothetical protein